MKSTTVRSHRSQIGYTPLDARSNSTHFLSRPDIIQKKIKERSEKRACKPKQTAGLSAAIRRYFSPAVRPRFSKKRARATTRRMIAQFGGINHLHFLPQTPRPVTLPMKREREALSSLSFCLLRVSRNLPLFIPSTPPFFHTSPASFARQNACSSSSSTTSSVLSPHSAPVYKALIKT